jgi:hypothetical protein
LEEDISDVDTPAEIEEDNEEEDIEIGLVSLSRSSVVTARAREEVEWLEEEAEEQLNRDIRGSIEL